LLAPKNQLQGLHVRRDKPQFSRRFGLSFFTCNPCSFIVTTWSLNDTVGETCKLAIASGSLEGYGVSSKAEVVKVVPLCFVAPVFSRYLFSQEPPNVPRYLDICVPTESNFRVLP
jgi:hypothetical protein